jgi:cell division protein FtsL
VASVVVAVVVVVAWFPAGALYHQRAALDATSTQLARLRAEDRALAAEQQRLGSAAEIARIARQQYELVTPHQQAYQVLPPNGSPEGADPGDPALQPLGSPDGAGAPAATPTTVPAAARTGAATARAGGAPGVLHRILGTLEFWR